MDRQSNQEPHPPTPYRFSNEELRVLQECNSEAFFQRSLPLSTIFGVATYLGVKNGTFQANGRFGSVPKVIFAVLSGYFIGKVSYQGKCAEKIMALPDSKLGDMLRERKRTGRFGDSLTFDQPEIGKIIGEMPKSDYYSDVPVSGSAGSHMDIDTDVSRNEIDDSYRPYSDDTRLSTDSFEIPSTPSPRTSYDELRRRNREDYELNRNKPQRSPLRPEEAHPSRETGPPRQLPDRTPERHRTGVTNEYGDTWDK